MRCVPLKSIVYMQAVIIKGRQWCSLDLKSRGGAGNSVWATQKGSTQLCLMSFVYIWWDFSPLFLSSAHPFTHSTNLLTWKQIAKLRMVSKIIKCMLKKSPSWFFSYYGVPVFICCFKLGNLEPPTPAAAPPPAPVIFLFLGRGCC